jgi:hypothetical protein
MRTEPLLKDQPILVVDDGNDLFIYDLEDALVAAGADVLLARNVATALDFVARFEFLACLLGAIDAPPEDYQRLAEQLAGTPVLRLGEESVPAIIAKLMRMLGKDDA